MTSTTQDHDSRSRFVRSAPVAGVHRPAMGCVGVLLATMMTASCEAARNQEGDEAGVLVLEPSNVTILGTSSAIAVVQDVEPLPDGRVWVLNSIEPFFIGFDARGEVTHEYGQAGGGPEEFRAPRGFVTGGIAGEAWAFDWPRNAIIEISQPDDTWSEIALPGEHVRPGQVIGGRDLTDNRVRLARLGGEVIIPRTTGTMDAGMLSFWLAIWGADLLALDLETDSVRTLLSLGEVLGDPTGNLEMTGFPPFPIWFRLWAVCGEELRVYDRLGNQVRAFSSDGTELAATPLPPPRFTTVTHREFGRAVLGLIMAEQMGAVGGQVSPEDSLRILNQALANSQGEPEQLAQFLPRYVDFRCEPDGTLWLRPLDLELGGLRGGPAWLRVRRDGTTHEVRFPERFDPYRFTAERVWGVQRDELDVASIAWIELSDS